MRTCGGRPMLEALPRCTGRGQSAGVGRVSAALCRHKCRSVYCRAAASDATDRSPSSLEAPRAPFLVQMAAAGALCGPLLDGIHSKDALQVRSSCLLPAVWCDEACMYCLACRRCSSPPPSLLL